MPDADNATESEDLHIAVCEEDLTGHDLQVASPVMENGTSNNNTEQVVSPATVDVPSTETPDVQDTEMEQGNAGEGEEHAVSKNTSDPEPEPAQEVN